VELAHAGARGAPHDQRHAGLGEPATSATLNPAAGLSSATAVPSDRDPRFGHPFSDCEFSHDRHNGADGVDGGTRRSLCQRLSGAHEFLARKLLPRRLDERHLS
jgi:hypothetical protein